PRVTHPFATLLIPCGTFAFDLHVLGTPPALILSQDQTLMLSSLARHRSGLRQTRIRAQLVNARPIYWLCVVQSVRVLVVHRQSPSHGLTTPVDRFRNATC